MQKTSITTKISATHGETIPCETGEVKFDDFAAFDLTVCRDEVTIKRRSTIVSIAK